MSVSARVGGSRWTGEVPERAATPNLEAVPRVPHKGGSRRPAPYPQGYTTGATRSHRFVRRVAVAAETSTSVRGHDLWGDGILKTKLAMMVALVSGSLMAVSCTPPPEPQPEPEAETLAVAYSNLDGIDGYDPTGTDVLIAKLVDETGDGEVSVGDLVVTNLFPGDFIPSEFSPLPSSGTAEVTVVHSARPSGEGFIIQVGTDGLRLITFYRSPNTESIELYDGSHRGLWEDGGENHLDQMTRLPSWLRYANYRGPGGDNEFLDVDIFLADN